MDACFCKKCGRVFPSGTVSCPSCHSPEGLSRLKAGKALPVSRSSDGTLYRDSDFGRRWVAVPTEEGIRLFDPSVASHRIRGDGRRVGVPYGSETLGDIIVRREDWETSDGSRWVLQWRFRIGTDVPICEVVG